MPGPPSVIFLGLAHLYFRRDPYLQRWPSSRLPHKSQARRHRWTPASAPSLERSPGTPCCPAPRRAAGPCGAEGGRLSAAGAAGPAGRSTAPALQTAAPRCSAGCGRRSGPRPRRRSQGPACNSASSGCGPADWPGKGPGDTGTIPQHPSYRRGGCHTFGTPLSKKQDIEVC